MEVRDFSIAVTSSGVILTLFIKGFDSLFAKSFKEIGSEIIASIWGIEAKEDIVGERRGR